MRVKFPEGFTSDDPLCSIVDYDSSGKMEQYKQTTSKILPATLNEIDCGPITNLTTWLGIDNEVTLKMENMINPLTAGDFLDIQIQLVRSLHNQPV